MEDKDLDEFIIHGISRHRNPNDIIRDVCKKTGMNWEVAKLRVLQVATNNRDKIISKRKPILIFVAVMTIFSGFVIMIAVGWATINGAMAVFITMPIPFLPNIILFSLGFLISLGGMMGLIKQINIK